MGQRESGRVRACTRRSEPDWTPVGFEREASSTVHGLPSWGTSALALTLWLLGSLPGQLDIWQVPYLLAWERLVYLPPARVGEDGSHWSSKVLSPFPATCF